MAWLPSETLVIINKVRSKQSEVKGKQIYSKRFIFLKKQQPLTGVNSPNNFILPHNFYSTARFVKRWHSMPGGYFVVRGYWGCASGWGRNFASRLTIMGLHF